MTMHDPTHPHDERLAALAGGDPEATDDLDLRAHVGACRRCTTLVRQLGAMRSALADLPDLQPSRPLQFLPPVDRPAGTGRGWLRRAFAPALVLGGAMMIIGAVNLGGNSAAGLGAPAAAPERANASAAVGVPAASSEGGTPAFAGGGSTESDTSGQQPADHEGTVESLSSADEGLQLGLPLVVAGLVLVVAALVLRYVVVPRAG